MFNYPTKYLFQFTLQSALYKSASVSTPLPALDIFDNMGENHPNSQVLVILSVFSHSHCIFVFLCEFSGHILYPRS